MPRRRPVRSILSALVCCCLAASTVDGKKSPPKETPPPPPPGELAAAMHKVLDGRQDRVQTCAARDEWPPNVVVDIAARLMINNLGQVISCDVAVTGAITPPVAGRLRTCIEEALRSAPFPKSKSPLLSLSRSWRIGG